MAAFPQEIRAPVGHCVSRAFGILTVKLRKDNVWGMQSSAMPSKELLGKHARDALISLGLQILPQ